MPAMITSFLKTDISWGQCTIKSVNDVFVIIWIYFVYLHHSKCIYCVLFWPFPFLFSSKILHFVQHVKFSSTESLKCRKVITERERSPSVQVKSVPQRATGWALLRQLSRMQADRPAPLCQQMGQDKGSQLVTCEPLSHGGHMRKADFLDRASVLCGLKCIRIYGYISPSWGLSKRPHF